MAFLKNAALSLAVLGFVATAPLTAHAIEVDCELRDGSTCTVSNDPVDSVTCACSDDGAGSGSTAGDGWADFDEEQLLEVCMSEVAFCEAAETDGNTTGMSSTSGTSDSTGDSTGGDTGDGTESSTGDSGPGSTGDTSPTTGTSAGGDSSGSGPGTTPSDTDSNGTASGDDGGPATTTEPETGGGEGESSSGAEEDNEDPSGCSVDDRGRSSGVLFAMFGLALGLRSRRRR